MPTQRDSSHHRPLSEKFLRNNPIGTVMTPERFDEWAISKKLLSPTECDDKSSGEWLRHVQRRYALKYKINGGAKFLDAEDQFSLDVLVPNRSWIVASLVESVAMNRIPQRTKSFQETLLRNETSKAKAVDWSKHPAWEKRFADAELSLIKMFIERHEADLAYILEYRRKLASGLMSDINKNGGLTEHSGIVAVVERSGGLNGRVD